MLKRNWYWRNYRLFYHSFVIGEISIGKGGGPPAPSSWLRLCSKWGKQKRCWQIFCNVSGVFQQNCNCSKNSAVLEPRTGQFSRTWGFEAKAKAKTWPSRPRPRTWKCVLEDSTSVKHNATYAIAEVSEVALCASNCALPTSATYSFVISRKK